MSLRTIFESLRSFVDFALVARPRSHKSRAATIARRLHVRSPRMEHLEERTLLSIAYVDDSATGANNGTSWANAYTSLQSALQATPAPATEIRVGQGTYRPTATTDRTVSFALRNGVSIFGGYAGYGAADPDARNVALYASVLSGDIGTPGSTGDNSYHVVIGSGTNATAVLDGFTSTAGKANGSSQYRYGGGMYTSGGSPTIANCTFTANSAYYYGGGMFNDSSSPALLNCTFTGNWASSGGGGMFNDSSSPALLNCTFTGNWASSGGGGMYNVYSSPTLTNCTFTANLADRYDGGGMFNDSSSSPTLTNCTFTANSAGGYGGGISNGSSTSSVITNCIFWANTAPGAGQVYGGTPAVTYCDVQGGYNGTGNIDADPQLVRSPAPGPDHQWGTADDDYGDLRIRALSPAADAGNGAAVPPGTTTDLAGNPRFADVPTTVDTGTGTTPVVDMGAYEAVAALDVEAAGPYAILEGHQAALHGFGASSQPGALTYEWDFDGDGQYDDAVGPSPTFSAAALSGPRTLTIAMHVTDGASASVTDAAIVVIAPAVAYVDDTAVGLNDGTGWTNAYTSLQSALALSAPGEAIRVAQGTYRPTLGSDRTASILSQSGVAIYGGYAGYGAADPDVRDAVQYPSMLSGDIGAAGDTADNSYHVVLSTDADATAVLDGFAITAGNANGSSSFCYNRGGGMFSSGGSPTLSNCTFSANSASGSSGSEGDGGGMYNFASSPTLTNCTFTANRGSYGGGGMYNFSSSPTLIRCTFTTNSASYGGGVYNHEASSGTLTNCTFTANLAGSYGGGMYNSSLSSPVLTNCTFAANRATGSSGYGGGMYNYASSPTLTNCTFAANRATGSSGAGGGMYNTSSSPKVTNCILWGNSATSGSQIYGAPVVTYSDIQQDNGVYPGGGNINADPLFARNPSPGADGTWGTADDDFGDLRLQPTSPCIDAGNNAAVPVGTTTDLAGNPRFVDMPTVPDTGSGTPPIVDLGAYEYGGLTVAGTDGADQFTLSLTPDHASIQIVSPGGTNTYPVAAVLSLRFTGGAGGDRLTVDCTNGNPIPVGGVAFDAGPAQDPGDSLIVQGTGSGDSVVLNGSQVTVNGSVISSSNVEFFGLDLGGQPSGGLTGDSGLAKTGPGTLVLSGTSGYSGPTTVDAGTLQVTGADALFSGTALTIGSGGRVVLTSGMTKAIRLSSLEIGGFGGGGSPAGMTHAKATVPDQPSLGARVNQYQDSPPSPQVAPAPVETGVLRQVANLPQNGSLGLHEAPWQPAPRYAAPCTSQLTARVARAHDVAILAARATPSLSAYPKGTVPFSLDENRDSPPLIPSPILSEAAWIGVCEELTAGRSSKKGVVKHYAVDAALAALCR